MERKLAIKKLTASDLTLFEWHFKNKPAGKQKAINLNANVFINVLYPSLPEEVSNRDGSRIPLDISFYGPGLYGEYNLQRKIVKGGTYKNYRLDGEYVSNPLETPERFNCLEQGDFVIFDFVGNIYPTGAKAVLIARKLSEDEPLHKAIISLLNTFKMKAVTLAELNQIISIASPPRQHPIYELLLDNDLEDIAQGGGTGIENLLQRKSGRKISKNQLKKAKEGAEITGERGEEYVNIYLNQQKTQAKIQDFKWESYENAIALYDFCITVNDQQNILIDVKTTKGNFNRNLHISIGELKTMKESSYRYDIYRVFELNDLSAKLCIAENVKDFASHILSILDNLPEGVIVDSVSVDPSNLTWNDEVIIDFIDLDDE